MTTCPTCGSRLSPEARFCALCGTPTDISDAMTRVVGPDAEALTIAPAIARPASAPPASRPSTASANLGNPSWLSTPDISHGRFPPGTVIGARYRIVGRLGQGGMGEVYRADDLKLGQPVALKFLPPDIEADAVRLAQFHNEVRLARQISHKNVCRMYDVGDADGLPFMTMEYVDGEDLASLLRRIGRLPADKALEAAHQLCAGLAAAHERGVLHRDLKPANVMIDGAGQVRITDFGLAAIEGTADLGRAGTPAYMAPEVLAGADPSPQSDVFALGLVIYELFTGRRAYSAANIRELIRQQNESTIEPPRAIVKDIDPAVDRAIMQALERDPGRRPRSALAVAASLPGGDPLAAALAAGETPSPEMVAAAGQRAAASRVHSIEAAVAVIAALVICAAISTQNRTLSRLSLDKPPAVLVDRAHQVLGALGYDANSRDSQWQIDDDDDFSGQLKDHPESIGDPAKARPGLLLFRWRSSPRTLIPLDSTGAVTALDPPPDVSGMTSVVLDMTGRLVMFTAVPQQVEEQAPSPSTPDWPVLFRLAGLDLAQFQAAEPRWLPRRQSDTRAAWTGRMPDGPSEVRVEAAAWRGRPMYFQIIMPWTRPVQMEEPRQSFSARILNAAEALVTVLLLAFALLLARKNLRDGRGDWIGAKWLALTAIFTDLLAAAVVSPHYSEPSLETSRFFAAVGDALFSGGVLLVMYLAVEPAVRRHWPDSLLGSTRLLRGRVVDARVGRDVLVGLGAGACMMMAIWAREPLNHLLGVASPAITFSVGDPRLLAGPGNMLGYVATQFGFQSMFAALWCILAIVGLLRLLKRPWLVAIVATTVLTLVAGRNLFVDAAGAPWLNMVTSFAVVGVIVVLAVTTGLLATATALLTTNLLSATPWTLEPGAWFFPQSVMVLALLMAMAAGAGYAMSTGAADASAARPS